MKGIFIRISPRVLRLIGLVCVPVIMLGLVIGNVTYARLSTRNISSNNPTIGSSKGSSFLGQLAKKIVPDMLSTTPSPAPQSDQDKNTPSSNSANNTNNSTNSNNSNTSQTPVTQTPTTIATQSTASTVPVPTTQAQAQSTKAPTAAPTNAVPTPTPIVTRLSVLGCYEFGLNYCRQGLASNGSVYGGRLKVRNANTGELLASETLDRNGRVTVVGLPINKELEVVLLPPADNPDYCGDKEVVKFLSYKTYISIELDLYRNVTPCISN